jgi:hypothetical protein
MAAHTITSRKRPTAALPPGSRSHRTPPMAGALSVLVGIGYGAYTSFIARSGGPATFGQLWLALASGVGMIVAIRVLLRFKSALSRELRAAAWGVLAGGSIGFLFSLTNESVLRAAAVGVAIFLGTTFATHYVYYTQETPAGRPPRRTDAPPPEGTPVRTGAQARTDAPARPGSGRA